MFCSNCGKEIVDESRFCPICGAQAKAPTKATQSPTQIPTPTHEIRYQANSKNLIHPRFYNGPSILDNIFCKNKLESSYEKTLQFRF